MLLYIEKLLTKVTVLERKNQLIFEGKGALNVFISMIISALENFSNCERQLIHNIIRF